MDKIILEIPTKLLEAAKLTPEEAKTELAIRLYQTHKLNDEQAVELAGDPKVIKELAWRNQETGHLDLDDFIAWAAHDLKTPLNAIIGFSRVVIKGMDGPINEIQAADLTTVFNGGQRMLVLLNNLVDMARLNNGYTKLSLDECDMINLIGKAAERWQTQNPTKILTTEINVSISIFNVDEARLSQVITNLLTYAAIRVTEGSLTLSAKEDESDLNITIQSLGQKSRDKSEMDSAMLGFISSALIKLHGGKTETIEETEGGMLIRFSIPR
jgi:K+-sensing histidine kinase KdpD/predicted HTH domain antitoxin